MKTLNLLVKTILITFWVALLMTCSPLPAQDIMGKWESLLYNEVVHFHEEGILRIEGENGDGYGMYAVEGDFLATAFLNEEQTRMQYTISFDDEGTLNLQESETGEIYPFVHVGTAEIPQEILEQIRLALNSNEEPADTGIEETPVADHSTPTTPVQEVLTSGTGVFTELPGTLPAPGTRGSSGIAGTWQQESSALGKETLVLTADGYFMMTAEAMFPDLYPQTFGYGKYDLENNQLKLHFFNFFQTYDKETVWNIRDLNASSFNVPFDFYGDIQDNRYLYKGAPELAENHRRTLLAWATFHRMHGQWRSKKTVLKFMGDGEVIVESADGNYTLSNYSISHDGITVNFKRIEANEGDYFYTGKIREFTTQKLVIESDKTGELEILAYEGESQLTSEQIQVFTAYMQAKHRANMGIIDAMDGTQDWIWIEDKY